MNIEFLACFMYIVYRSNTLEKKGFGHSSHSAPSSRHNTGDLPQSQHPMEVEVLLRERYPYNAVTKALSIVDNNIEKARMILEAFILKWQHISCTSYTFIVRRFLLRCLFQQHQLYVIFLLKIHSQINKFAGQTFEHRNEHLLTSFQY